MSSYFSTPLAPALLLPLYAAFLLFCALRGRGRPRQGVRRWVLHGLGVLSLIFAAGGFQIPAARTIELVAVVDVSDSVFDLASQTARLRELLRPMEEEPGNIEVAVVVFGGTAATERAMSALATAEKEGPPGRAPRGALRSRGQGAAVPDLARLSSVVDRSATDIGGALEAARGLFGANSGSARAILLLSDFRATRGNAAAAAAALDASDIELLATPALLGPSSDVRLAALSVPLAGTTGRGLPIEATVAAQAPATVEVSIWKGGGAGREPVWVGSKTIELKADASAPGEELRATVRLVDRPNETGVAAYFARVGGVGGSPLPGDVRTNNQLSAAARISGPSRWAILTRANSTLARLHVESASRLGVESDLYEIPRLPRRAAAYAGVSGILVDGLSAAELDDAALRALAEAVEGGKALVAAGGEQAFGAGGHRDRDGAWQRLLPVYMTPEDDRARAVLFLIDVSKSMEEPMGHGGGGVRKIDFASEQLAQALQKLKPSDRLGLITFSGSARLAAPLSPEPSRAPFLAALKDIRIEQSTDLQAALQLARETLREEDADADEQLIVLLSDGIQTVARPREQMIETARELAGPATPDGKRRRTLYTFGIDTGPQDVSSTGGKLLADLAQAGGGSYSPDFLKLGARLEQALEGDKKEFYTRREAAAVRPVGAHALLGQLGGAWPAVPFRNRVKAKPDADTLLASGVARASPPADSNASRRADPLLVLSGPRWQQLSRRAVLALSLDGEAGSALWGSESGARLLPSLLAWCEARTTAAPGAPAEEGWSVQAEARDDDQIEIEVRAWNSRTQQPSNGRKLSATLTLLDTGAGRDEDGNGAAPEKGLAGAPLHPSAPGVYRLLVPTPRRGVYRLAIEEDAQSVHERFLTVPYLAEFRAFGTDRAAMRQLAAAAGGNSRVIESAGDMREWAAQSGRRGRAAWPLRPILLGLGIVLLLAEFALRIRR